MAASWIASFLYAQFFKRPPYPTKSFAGQTIIVTGSNTGLGLEAAKHFVRLSASHVILAVRNASKGEAAKASILASLPNASSTISVWSLDLTSFESVKAFAEQVKGLERLDAVVENAGMATAVWKEIEGYESTVLTNVISTELLTLLVLPKLRESGLRFNTVPRLSIVTSDMHFVAGFEEGKADDVFAALNDKEGKGFGERYSVSKLMEIYFVRELAKRMDASKKAKVIVNCMTPGACKSDFDRESAGVQAVIRGVLQFLIARTTEVGSRTLVAGVAAGEESHGQYMADAEIAQPANFVTSEEGQAMQLKLWRQTMKRLDDIVPGIENNV